VIASIADVLRDTPFEPHKTAATEAKNVICEKGFVICNSCWNVIGEKQNLHVHGLKYYSILKKPVVSWLCVIRDFTIKLFVIVIVIVCCRCSMCKHKSLIQLLNCIMRTGMIVKLAILPVENSFFNSIFSQQTEILKYAGF